MASLSMGARGSSLRSFSCLPFHSTSLSRSFTALSFHELAQASSHFQRVHLIFTVARSAPIKLDSDRLSFSFSSSFCSSASAYSSDAVSAVVNEKEGEEEYEDWDEYESEEESEEWDEQESEERPVEREDSDDGKSAERPALTSSLPITRSLIYRKFPPLSPKEKKDLRAYAHSLGKKIVSQQIGKAGVTESLAKAIGDALEAKEIVKLKVLSNCPDELEEVIAKIEEATQGQVVGKIGNVITLYRPSLRKQLKEAQKLQNRPAQGRQRKLVGSGQGKR